MTKNAFCFMLKAFFVLDIFLSIFIFLSRVFGYIEKHLDKKSMVNFKIYDVTDWTTNNYNTHIAQYLKFGQLKEHNVRNIFLENHTQNVVEKLVRDPLIKNQN